MGQVITQEAGIKIYDKTEGEEIIDKIVSFEIILIEKNQKTS